MFPFFVFRRETAGGLVRKNTVTTRRDGSPVNLAQVMVAIVLHAGSKDETVRRGGRAQAVRCLLSCVSSTEIEVSGHNLATVGLYPLYYCDNETALIPICFTPVTWVEL